MDILGVDSNKLIDPSVIIAFLGFLIALFTAYQSGLNPNDGTFMLVSAAVGFLKFEYNMDMQQHATQIAALQAASTPAK